MPVSVSGPSIVRYFLEKKVYWAVFFAEFGLDLKIVRYLMGDITHTACIAMTTKSQLEKQHHLAKGTHVKIHIHVRKVSVAN